MAASAGAIRAGSAYVEIFARDGQFQQGMSRIRARLMTLGTQMRQAGTSMTLGGAALGVPFIMAARTAAAFSLEMARVRANTGATDQQFAQLNASAKNFAVQFGRAPEEVAGAMSELAKAGLDAEGVMKSISPILAVAAADNMELARAVEVAVSTMAQFGMTTNDFGAIADKLQATANASTTSVDSIGEALSYVGPKAQEAGQSFDDVAAAIATLADAGLRGSLGGTGLARVIESIANEEEKLAGLGVSTRDAAGGMRPFMDVLEDLGKQTAGMSNVDRIKLFTDIFEIRGANAAMSLSNMRDKFTEVLGTIQNSGGTALGKATSVMSSFGGAVAQLGAQFGVLQNQLIESMGPIATQAVQGFTKLLAVVGNFISRNGTLVTIVAGGTAALFGIGVASLAAGIALQGLATGLRVIQAVLPLIPALFSPIGLSIAAVSAAIAGGVVIARTLSPAFKEETDAIGAALMRLDFGAAWQVMNVNLAIALVQMHQAFAQAFDLVKNTVVATSQFVGDMLIQGLDRFMGLFGADILTLQAGFEKLGVYFRAAFDWDFAVNGMSDALKKVEARVEEARQRAPTADARAEQRKQEREKQAEGRNEEIKRRDAGFEDTIKELRKDAARARERALGKTDKAPAETSVAIDKPAKQKLPAAPPGAFMAPPETKTGKDDGIAGAGNWSGVGLDIGPEINRLEGPAHRTAIATEATAAAAKLMADRAAMPVAAQQPAAAGLNEAADAARERVARFEKADAALQEAKATLKGRAESELGITGSGTGDIGMILRQIEQYPFMQGDDDLSKEVSRYKEAKQERMRVEEENRNFSLEQSRDALQSAATSAANAMVAQQPGDFQAQLDAIAMMAADPNATAGDLLALGGNTAMAGQQQAAIAAAPNVAMDTVAARAPAVRQGAAQGVQAAMEVSNTGIVFQKVGSEIVAAINAGTEVSKSMLAALTKLADKKAPELAFQ